MGNKTGSRIERRRIGTAIVGIMCVPVAALAMTVGASGSTGGGAERHASVKMVDAAGVRVGSARLVEDHNGRVHVSVRVRNMTPGLHGIHVHNVASCASAAAAFSGAGSHHNPAGVTHGAHAGDLPNLTLNGAGAGRLHTRADRFSLTTGPNSAFDSDGSALVVHAAEDDLVTDPTGNSGARVACGVIVRR